MDTQEIKTKTYGSIFTWTVSSVFDVIFFFRNTFTTITVFYVFYKPTMDIGMGFDMLVCLFV
jgi:hypothetical protein